MSENTGDLDLRLAELKRAFDAAFAAPQTQLPDDTVEFLLVSAGGQEYALRVGELAGLEVNRRIVRVPTEFAAFLGLCAVRGQLLPVFDLAILLGGGATAKLPRWLALYRDQDLLALTFDEFQGTRTVPAAQVHALPDAPPQVLLSRHTVALDSRLIPVLDLPAVAANIRRQVQP